MKTDYSALLIDDYLTGELDEHRLSEFEKTLQTDSIFAREVEFQQEVFDAIKDDAKMSLRDTLEEIRKRESKKLMINFYSWKVQAVAAAITIFLLIGGSLSINLFTTTPSNQSLYSEYFNPETTLLTVRSGITTSAAIENGILLFNQEQYESAIVAFRSEPGNFTGKLYTGFSYMKLEQFDKAEMQFLAIIQNNDNLFVDQAEWNLGLCYLVAGKEPQAKQVISKIAEGNTAYSGKAEKLLLDMGKNN